MKRPKLFEQIFSSPTGERPDQPKPPSLAEWFRVTFDDSVITLDVRPPHRPPWGAEIRWERIVRVCFKSGSWDTPDEVYIFTDERPESYLIPTEADGGAALWGEIVRRKLFSAEMSIEAATSTDRLFCWPPSA